MYESKDAPFRGLGALMLAPNALRILDSLGLYTQLRSHGFNFSTVEFRDENDAIKDTWQMGNQDRYGYDALRITRPVFLDILRSAVADRGIEIKYATKYSHVVEETAENVTFQFVDGTRVTADILVGADGVYSEVRKNVAPHVLPTYGGSLAIIATVKHRFTDRDHVHRSPQTTFYHSSQPNTGGLLVLPQECDGSHACLGIQRKYPEQSREDWVHLSYEKDKLYDLFMQKSVAWPARVNEALAKVDKNDIYIWPFHALPDMPSWTSLPHRRTVLVGDAAHSVPPTAGQGGGMAVEDAYTLAMLISTVSRANLPPESYAHSVASWQAARQERVQRARLFTKQLDNNRLSQSERKKLPDGTYWEAGEHPDMAWLYGAGLANSNAKGVTRVEVKKERTGSMIEGNRHTVTKIRAATVDGAYGLDQQQASKGEIINGAC